MDPILWEPFVSRVAFFHGFECRRILPGLPGSYPTFIVELSHPHPQAQTAIVIKFFGSLFDGAVSFLVEKAMGQFVKLKPLSIRSPVILAEGRLDSEWAYLVFEHIPGVSIGQVRAELSWETMESVAQQVGVFMRELHFLTATTDSIIPLSTPGMSWEPYIAFLENQRSACLKNHQHWQDLPAQLLHQVPGYLSLTDELVDLSSPPYLIHADLTADHLLGKCIITGSSPTSVPQVYDRNPGEQRRAGRQWESLAIIDWGDSRVGNILYELVAIQLDLFRADKYLLRKCLEAYRLPIFFQMDFPRKALSMMLLHQFPMPASVYAPYRASRSLDELAGGLFGV